MTEPELPGLQVERTQLAWRRTSLAGTVVFLLVLSHAVISGARPMTVVAAGLAMAGWLALLGVAHRRVAQLSHGGRDPIGHSPIILVALILGYAVVSSLVVLSAIAAR